MKFKALVPVGHGFSDFLAINEEGELVLLEMDEHEVRCEARVLTVDVIEGDEDPDE